MKKIIFALLALAVVALYSCEKENDTPSGNNSTNQGGDTPTPSDTIVTPPAPTKTFYGDWDLMFQDGSNAHVSAVFNETLIALLQSQSVNIGNVDTNVSLTGSALGFLVEQASGNQVTITGSVSIDILHQWVGQPVTFSFTTTGTIGANGLTIQPAQIGETIEVMTVPINLTGTITFSQPTALPVDGNLTVDISSLVLNGTGDVMGVSNAVAVNVHASYLQALGKHSKKPLK